MIDLSLKKSKQNTDGDSLGAVILTVMPFVLMIFWGIVHAL